MDSNGLLELATRTSFPRAKKATMDSNTLIGIQYAQACVPGRSERHPEREGGRSNTGTIVSMGSGARPDVTMLTLSVSNSRANERGLSDDLGGE